MVPLGAQPFVTIAATIIPGVRVYGPETPEYAKHLSDLGIDPTLSSAAAWVPYSMVVRNESSRPIAKFSTRYDYVGRTGRMTASGWFQEPREGFAPGETRLITVRSMNAVPSEAILRSPILRISLDSVLFADGDFHGPDQYNYWKRLNSEQEFVRRTRIEFEQMGNDMERIRRKLDEMNKQLLSGKLPPDEVVNGSMARMRSLIQGVLSSEARKGYEPYRDALQAQFGEQTFFNFKRKY